MSKPEEIVGTIRSLRPLRSSAAANPRYEVTLTDGQVFKTVVDTACAYGLENPEYRDVPVRFGIEGGQIATAVPA